MTARNRNKPHTLNELRDRLSYDPLTGEFHWKFSVRRRLAGDRAGSKTSLGYTSITVDDRAYRAGRLAWLFMTGEPPSAEIDHINGVRDDDRFANLRLATRFQNMANIGRPSNNKTGFKGVSMKRGRFRACIRSQGVSRVLGVFDTAEEAHAAYCAAAQALSGDFANFGKVKP